MNYSFSKILQHDSGLHVSRSSAATQTAYPSGASDQKSCSQPIHTKESKGTETEETPFNEAHALRLREAEGLVAQLRAENLAQKNEVRDFFPYKPLL